MGFFKFMKTVGNTALVGAGLKSPASLLLEKQVADMGLKAEGLKVKVEDDKVKVTGKADSTDIAEKIILALGNNQGIAEVESELIVAKETPAAKMYMVKKGDTLWKIAEAHYGKGKGEKYKDIVKANTPPVKDPDLIQPGWVLRLPPLS